MFFIVSTGRSGTKAIAKTLSSLPNCISLHEPAPQLIAESSAYRYGELAASDLRSILLATRPPPETHGRLYCESNQTLSLLIPVLAETFPQARYVWLIRNGLDVVASTYSKQWYSGHSENHDRYEDCPPIERAWIDGRIQGDRCGDVSPREWQDLDRFGRCCWYWSYVNRTVESDLQRYAAGRYRLVRLEELDHELPELVKWMGLKAALVPRLNRYNPGKREPYHWTQWSVDDRAVFLRWCGSLMDKFYPTWRTGDTWNGVTYKRRNGLLAAAMRNYKLVKRLNHLFMGQ